MKLCVVFLWVQWSWLPSGQALYHEDSTTFTLSTPKQNGSYFGFSITYAASIKRLIVGAPRGSDVGQVFSCDIDSRNCTNIPIPITRYGTIRNHTSNEDVKFNHDYWLGASLGSDAEYIYTCAPRAVGELYNRWCKLTSYALITGGLCPTVDYHRLMMKLTSNVNRRPFCMFPENGSRGVCFKISQKYNYSSSKFEVLDYSTSRYDVNLYEEFAESIGWSMDVGPEESIIIGGPAMYTGRVSNIKHFSNPKELTGRKTNIQYNFGYSVAIGNFITGQSGHRSNISYAVGSPYGFGTVVIYQNSHHSSSTVAYKIEGSVVGSMFGAVLCAAHISDPEQPAALFVGAPTHALGLDYDVGAVFVYIKRTLIRVIKGRNIGARFGLAITNVGDLNGDIRDEVAIAAPYEVDGRGAVYVYCGASIVGEDATLGYMQRLEPRPGDHVRGFGLALAPLLDYDQNGCNELAIGAPYSDSVSLLRCFATIKLQLYTMFPDMKSRNTSYFHFDACLRVTYPNKTKQIRESVNVTLSIIHPHARLADSALSEYTVSLENMMDKYCRKVDISTPLEGDYSTPIVWKMSAVQLDHPLKHDVFNASRVVISDLSVTSFTGTVSVANCTSDPCLPMLALDIYTHVRLNESSNSEAFSVVVNNSGDVAYGLCVRLRVDGAIIITSPKSNCSSADGILTCKPQRPLRNMDSWHLDDITLDMTKLKSNNTEVTVFLALYPRCDDSIQNEYSYKTYSRNVQKTS